MSAAGRSGRDGADVSLRPFPAAKVSSPAKEKSDSNGTAPVASASAVAADADVDVKMETASEEPKPTLTTAMEVDEDKPKREPSEERGREEEVKPKRDNSEVGGGREEEASSREPVGRGTISRDTVVIDSSNTQLFIKTIPPDISRKDLEEVSSFPACWPKSRTDDSHPLQHCKQVPGFDYLALSEPLPLKKYHRVGWVQFKTVEDMPKAIEVLCESKVRSLVTLALKGPLTPCRSSATLPFTCTKPSLPTASSASLPRLPTRATDLPRTSSRFARLPWRSRRSSETHEGAQSSRRRMRWRAKR